MIMNNNKKAALVVDDEEEICSFISDYLEENNFISYSATEIEQALKIMQKNRVDVILLDNNLPNSVRGVDFVTQFKSINPQCKIFMLTANSRPDVIEKAVDRGVEGYLVKPFDFEVFVNILNRIQDGA